MGMTTTKAQLSLVPTGKKVMYNGTEYVVDARAPQNRSLPDPKSIVKYLRKGNEFIELDNTTIVDVILKPQDCCMGAAFM